MHAHPPASPLTTLCSPTKGLSGNWRSSAEARPKRFAHRGPASVGMSPPPPTSSFLSKTLSSPRSYPGTCKRPKPG
eukprot:3620391-Pyramimonas_sp.AAC.1